MTSFRRQRLGQDSGDGGEGDRHDRGIIGRLSDDDPDGRHDLDLVGQP
jgi:hypothetical protein